MHRFHCLSDANGYVGDYVQTYDPIYVHKSYIPNICACQTSVLSVCLPVSLCCVLTVISLFIAFVAKTEKTCGTCRACGAMRRLALDWQPHTQIHAL